MKTPYTAEWYAAINRWSESPRDAIPCNNNDKRRNDQSSREQQAEDKKAYASHGFERIFCAYKGHNERLRNVTGIPEGRIEGANSINTGRNSQSRRQEPSANMKKEKTSLSSDSRSRSCRPATRLMPSGGRLLRKQNHIIVEFFEEETGRVIEQLDVPLERWERFEAWCQRHGLVVDQFVGRALNEVAT